MEKIIQPRQTRSRETLCRICFSLILLSLGYDFLSHTLVSQLKSPVFKFLGNDLTYWIFSLSGIPKLISQNAVLAIIFDVVLFVSCGLTCLFPSSRLWPRLFSILYFIYFIIYNTYAMHHEHARIGILLMSFPFVFAAGEGFLLIWEGVRYFTCYIYASAFFWKLFRGSWISGRQAVLVIKKNLTPYLYYHSGSGLAGIYYYLFQHPAIAEMLMRAGFLFEGFFLVGFFTTRYDRYLLVFSILLPLGFLFMADALFFEVAFLAIFFIKIRARGERRPV